MNDYETRRLENIKRNKALIQQLGLPSTSSTNARPSSTTEPAAKRRKVERVAALPSRTSARIASAPIKVVTYNEDDVAAASNPGKEKKGSKKKQTSNITRVPIASSRVKQEQEEDEEDSSSISPYDVASLRESWSSWTPSAPPPTLDETGTYLFPTHPDFTPNLSPADILRQGAFGGTYFRPYY